jgi:hypothetical protein
MKLQSIAGSTLLVSLSILAVIDSFPLATTRVQPRPYYCGTETQSSQTHHVILAATKPHRSEEEDSSQRRSILLVGLSSLLLLPTPAWAGIDVSGLRVEGGAGGAPAIKEQLRAFDGSGATRVQSIQTTTTPSATTTAAAARGNAPSQSSTAAAVATEDLGSAATYAYRAAPGLNPRLSKLGFAGERYRCDDRIVASSGSSSSSSSSNKSSLNVQFEYPSDWLQLDKMLGGIQYVDQRNGDKLYILRATLPMDTTLTTVSKQWFGESLFDPRGTIARGGVEVDEFKVSKSTILNEGVLSTPHRRCLIKYFSVTPNGLRTERRGLVDAYEIEGVAYMLFTGSNAVKFEKNGIERETVEAIANSFRVEY